MRSSRWLGLSLLFFGSTLAACGGGPQGSPPPVLSTTSPISTATPAPTGTNATPTASATATGSATSTPVSTATATAAATATATAAATATPTMAATPTPAPTTAATPGSVTLPAGEKIFVVNHGILGDNPSVTIYPSTATGAAAPIATIAGSNTDLHQAYFDVVDSAGTLYVSNASDKPGTQTAGYITEYAATDQSGNVPPTATITGLHNPQGLAIDAAGNLYVAVVDAIEVFAPGAKGNAVPIRTIVGAKTTLQNLVVGGQPAGLALDLAGDVFVAMGPVVLEFPPQANGNVAPALVYGGVNGSNVATTGPPYGSATLSSCQGIAIDAAGNLYAANFNNSSYSLFPNATGAASGTSIQSTSAGMPFGMNIDTAGAVYAANYSISSVDVFSSMATFSTGVATATISGTASGLDHPYGVTTHL